jgi:hypothetical protein
VLRSSRARSRPPLAGGRRERSLRAGS